MASLSLQKARIAKAFSDQFLLPDLNPNHWPRSSNLSSFLIIQHHPYQRPFDHADDFTDLFGASCGSIGEFRLCIQLEFIKGPPQLIPDVPKYWLVSDATMGLAQSQQVAIHQDHATAHRPVSEEFWGYIYCIDYSVKKRDPIFSGCMQ